MKKTSLISGLFFLLGIFALQVRAQSYDQMWKEVENLEKKDLPKSAINQLDKIYAKAAAERNAPQMMKAFLVRTEAKVSLSADGLNGELEALRRWTAEEKDTVARAVLHHIMGVYQLEEQTADVDSALWYFRESLKYPDVLARVTAKDYRPMVESGKLSEKYFGDTMLDLLVRQAAYRFSWGYVDVTRSKEAHRAVMDFYNSLIDYYVRTGNRSAELLTRLCLLSYRQGGEMVPPVRLSQTEEVALLRNWMKEYAGVSSCAAVYVHLTELYHRNQQFTEAMQVIDKGLELYPRSEFAADLKDYRQRILNPSLNLHTEWAYPGEDAVFEVRSKNLKGMTLEVYRLNLKASSSIFAGGMERADMVKKYGKLAGSKHFALPDTPDYKDTASTFVYRMPEPGIYMLKSVPDGHKDKAAYELVHLSPLQILSFPLEGKQTEYDVVDRKTGHPVPGAEIVFYSIPTPGNYTLYRTFKTDGSGRAVVPELKERSLWMNARTTDGDFMQVSYVSRGRGLAVPSDGKETYRTELYTDRALYRPGQTVYVSGVAYKQQGDDTKVRSRWKFTLTLRDANGQELSKRELVTDDFGGFHAEFALPQSVLPGNFRLEAENGNRYIRVDEYKRPTFDVVFTPYKESYTAGDTLSLEAAAKNFSGAPVRNGKVSYTVTRSQAWFWRIGGGSSQVIGSGETQTDADGKFRIEAVLEKPETSTGDWNSYYIYKVSADVVNIDGETQSGSLSLPVSKLSMGLQIDGLSAKVMREKRDKIQFLARNLNGQPVDTKVSYRIYTLDKDGKKGSLAAQGEQPAQTAFIPEALLDCASGKYRIEISADDSQGRTCKAEQDFALFSRNDVRPPYETTEWFYQEGTEFNEEHPVTLYVGSSEQDVYVFYSVYCGAKRIHSERLTLDNEIRKFVYPYKEAYGDGITVSFAFMRKGIFYTKQVSITRPEPQKELSLKWESFRDNLVPGGQEEWTLSILDRNGKPADARFMATLYDASLDRLLDNQWSFRLNFRRYTPSVWPGMHTMNTYFSLYSPFYDHSHSNVYDFDFPNGYSRLFVPSLRQRNIYVRGGGKVLMARSLASSKALYKAAADEVEQAAVAQENGFETNNGVFSMAITDAASLSSLESDEEYVPLRDNFAETAFFYSDLRTDSAGAVRMVFTMPDAVTEWKLMGMAHTQSMDYGLITAKARTSKPFMIQPNMPRFVRAGDRAVIAASLDNISGNVVAGIVRMQLVNPVDGKTVYESEQPFEVAANQNGSVSFEYEVTDTYDVLICRMVADAGEYSDGEQHYLPILTDKQWVTETLPFQLKDNESKTLELDDLFNKQSKTATGRRLSFELTANPVWYAVQALPVLSNPDSENAFAWAGAYYGNALAQLILDKNPEIRQVFSAWASQSTDKDTWLSKLEQNQDLKNMLLNETPWLTEATDESEQKRRIAVLFDLNQMKSQLQTSVDRLGKMQHTDGSWSWFDGMAGSRIVTTQVAELMARLKAMNAVTDVRINSMYLKAWNWLTAQMQEEYRSMKRQEEMHELNVLPSNLAVKYLYICALDKFAASKADKAVNAYMLEKLKNRSAEYSIGEKAMIAVIMQGTGNASEAMTLVRSIKEYSLYTPEMGRYFDTAKALYSWNSYKIPTQVAAMEAIARVEPDESMHAEMQQWLLKQKQVQAWSNSLETADAIYALLCSGGHQLNTSGKMTVKAGRMEMETPDDALGYARRTYTGTDTDIKRAEISKTGSGIGWGAVYAQYLEEMDRLADAKGNGLSISLEVLKDGKRIDKHAVLNVGDKLTVRLNIKADRDMDFIQIKDERPACFEPSEQLSGYRWNAKTGIGYYQVSRDASTEFFIDKMRKGSYVIEYTVHVDRAGTYQAGMASIQSAYAPEFAGHTGGMKLVAE